MPMIVIAFGIFAGAMYFYRKMTAGETFSYEKFALTMGYGAIASLVLYLAAGALPSVDQVIAEIEVLAPGGAASVTALISAFLVIYNAATKYFTGKSSTTDTTAAPATATASTSDKFDPGFVPLPASQSLMSGQTASITLAAGKSAVTCIIDWRDNTGVTTLAFVNGMIATSHQYAYEFDGKHQSHAYHPLFTLKDASGRTKVFDAADDTATGGVDCTIGVTALGYALVQY